MGCHQICPKGSSSQVEQKTTMGGGVFVNNTAFRGTWEQQFKKKKKVITRKIIKEKDGTGRGGQRGGMWRLRPPEGRKHPEEPGSTSRRGGETAGKSEGRLSRFPPSRWQPQARRRHTALDRPRAGTPRPGSRRLRSAPACRAPLPIFGAHTLQGTERPGLARRAGGPPLGKRRRAAHHRSPPGAHSGPRAAALTSGRPAPPRRGAYLLLIGQLLLQIRHLPSGDKLWRWWRRPPDFPLSVRSSAPRAPAKGGARRPGRRARAPRLRPSGFRPPRTRPGAPPPQPRPPRTRPGAPPPALERRPEPGCAPARRLQSRIAMVSSIHLWCLFYPINDDHMDPVGDEYTLSPWLCSHQILNVASGIVKSCTSETFLNIRKKTQTC